MGPRNYTNSSSETMIPKENKVLSSEDTGNKKITSERNPKAADDHPNSAIKDILRFKDDYVTYLHGNWYDLTKFQHPGGPVALSLAYQRDSTVLFESHHPFATNRAYLASVLKPYLITSSTVLKYLNTKYSKILAPSNDYKFDFTYAASTLGIQSPEIVGNTILKGSDVRNIIHSSSSSSSSSLTSVGPSSKKNYPRNSITKNEDGSSSDESDTASDASSTSADVSDDLSSSSSSLTETLPTTTKSMDPFEAEIKDIVYNYFQQQLKQQQSSSFSSPSSPLNFFRSTTMRQITKTTWSRWLQLSFLLFFFIFAGIIPLVQGFWPAIVITPTLGWIWMVNHWHDAAHFALSSKWWINYVFTYLSPWFSSPLIWYHQHVIGHHSYTNIPAKDPDLYHAPKFWRFQSSLRFTSLHRYQEYTTIILWIFSVPTLLLLKPLGTLASGLYNRAVVLQKVSLFRRILHVLGRILVASSLYAWPWFMTEWSFFKQFCFAFVPISVYSLWFMGWSQVNHHTDETSESFHPNWYRHQVMTSHTIAPQSAVAFWLSGGLNLQIEHHLFPFINQEHLIPLQPLIEAAARKHNVPYTKSNTVIEAFVKLWNHLHILSIPPKVTTTTPGSKETKNTNNTNHHRTNGPKID